LIVAKGSAEVDIRTIDIIAGLSFSTRTLPSGNIVPYVTAVDVKANINRFDLCIHLCGNFFADTADLLLPIFKRKIAGQIEDILV